MGADYEYSLLNILCGSFGRNLVPSGNAVETGFGNQFAPYPAGAGDVPGSPGDGCGY